MVIKKLLLVSLIIVSLFLVSCTDVCKSVDELDKNNCYADLAAEKSDISYCENIEDSLSKDLCLEKVAVVIGDDSICGGLSSDYWKDNCYHDIALKNFDEKNCPLIINYDQRYDCYKTVAIENGDYLLCDNLVGTDIQKCLLAVAKETQDIEICAIMESDVGRDSCRYKVAQLSLDPTICEEIGFDEIKLNCESLFE